MADSVAIEAIKQLDADATEDLTDKQLNAYLTNGHLIASADKFPDDVYLDGTPVIDVAARYMALHLICTRSGTAGSGVTFEKADVLEEHYADTSKLGWYDRSPWGQIYLKLLHDYADGDTHFAVIQH